MYGTCFNEHKKSHATYVLVYAPMNPLQFLCTGGTQKSHVTYILVYAPMNPLQFLCTSGTQKISCDLRFSLCPYESITIFVYQWYTKNLMRLMF